MLEHLIRSMKAPFKSRKTKPTFEINWNIREIFSESALTSFCDEINNNKYFLKEEKK